MTEDHCHCGASRSPGWRAHDFYCPSRPGETYHAPGCGGPGECGICLAAREREGAQ